MLSIRPGGQVAKLRKGIERSKKQENNGKSK